MKKTLLTVLMMACAIIFLFSSCKKDKVEKDNESNTSQNTPTPQDPVGDGVIENAVTDVDGNTYKAVKLGDQVWMAENLRTTKYANGTSIALGSSTSATTAYRYNPNNSSNNVSTYGYLYNWKAVMGNSSSSSSNPSGVQGVCPNGWHVPSDAEWTQLTNYVSSQKRYVCYNNNSYIAKAMASTTGWLDSDWGFSPGNNPSSNNATGFAAIPAGSYGGYNGQYFSFGINAFFWSSTESNSGGAYTRYLYYKGGDVNRLDYSKEHAFSVRCVRN